MTYGPLTPIVPASPLLCLRSPTHLYLRVSSLGCRTCDSHPRSLTSHLMTPNSMAPPCESSLTTDHLGPFPALDSPPVTHWPHRSPPSLVHHRGPGCLSYSSGPRPLSCYPLPLLCAIPFSHPIDIREAWDSIPALSLWGLGEPLSPQSLKRLLL